MKGIVIAAGLGSRMKELSEDAPKCLLPIAGRPLLDWTVERLRLAGCGQIVIVVGYRAELIKVPGATLVENSDYRDNNILHSLMKARDHLSGPVMASYSDIWVEPHIHRHLAETEGDIVIAVDQDWQPYYEGRTLHPLGEAEKVLFDTAGRAWEFGKHLPAIGHGGLTCGEFLGLWRMSAAGARQFREVFLELEKSLPFDAPFHNARSWQKAYITDMLKELADRGIRITCALVRRGWAELDTGEDYSRLLKIAERQGLTSLIPERMH